MQNLAKIEVQNSDDEKKKLRNSLIELSSVNNMSSEFISEYKIRVKLYKETYVSEEKGSYINKIEGKIKIFENFKSNYLHSGFWGDKSKQEAALSQSSWFGESNVSKLSKGEIESNKNIYKTIKVLGREAADSLRKNHNKNK